jgi:hypothetical protein
MNDSMTLEESSKGLEHRDFAASRSHVRSRLLGLLRSWRYAETSKRDLRLDLLRGFAALVMIADHIGGNSLLWPLTGGDSFFVSAAEVFVLISGVLLGVVYGRVVFKKGLSAAVRKAIGRASKLYLLTISLTLAFALAGGLLALWWAPAISRTEIVPYVIQVVTLQRTLFLTDIMLMYTLLIAAAIPVLVLLVRGQTLYVLTASWMLWASWQIAPGNSAIFWEIEGNGLFKLPAWQVIFVTGIVLGYHRQAIERFVVSLPPLLLTAGVVLACAIVAVLYSMQATNLEALHSNPLLYTVGFDKANVPLGRIAVLALLSVAALGVTTMAWRPLKQATGWLLLPLGQNALKAYSLHLIVVAASTWLWTSGYIGLHQPHLASLFQVGGVLSIWLVIVVEGAARARLTRSRSAVSASGTDRSATSAALEPAAVA